MGVLFCLGIEQAPRDDSEPGSILLAGCILMMLVGYCIFQIYFRQRPILKICREGLWIRTIGTPMPRTNIMIILHAQIVIPIWIFWQCITLQAFRIRTIRLRWENIDMIPPEQYAFTLAGWHEKDYNDFDQNAPLEHYAVHYRADSFGVSVNKVIAAVQFFQDNPDERTMLPSWQEEVLPGNNTFNFDQR